MREHEHDEEPVRPDNEEAGSPELPTLWQRERIRREERGQPAAPMEEVIAGAAQE